MASLSLRATLVALLALAIAGGFPACGSDGARGLGGGPPAQIDAGGGGDVDIVFDVRPPDLGVSDAAADAPVTEEPPPSGECLDDAFEPSDASRPTLLDGPGQYDGLRICRFQDDWYRVALTAGDRLTVRIAFENAAGDLELMLWSEELRVLGRSETAADVEQVAYGATVDETVLIHVFGFEGATNEYALTLEVAPFGDDCAGDPEEPNDTLESAFPLQAPAELSSRLCEGDWDWFRVELPGGSTVSAVLAFTHALGDLDMRAYFAESPERALEWSASASDNEQLTVGPFEDDTALLFEVYGDRGAVNSYTLSVRTFSGATIAVSAAGNVSYEDRPFDAEGFTGERVARPARGMRIELVRAFDGAVMGEARSDAAGDFEVVGQVLPGETHYVRAVTQVVLDGFEARVVDRNESEAALYAVAGEPFAVTAPERLPVDLLASADTPAGGAFNIGDTTWDAFALLADHVNAVDTVLWYRWEAGRAYSCGSCYSDDVIRLGGGLEDTDEYDDDIILHELGHFFQDNYSAENSPGGDHDGEMLDPLLAFGEGGATFFSSYVQGDPEYLDLYVDSLRLRDLETADEDPQAFFGTDDGTLTGDVSEYLVAAVMWDAGDPASDAEPTDGLALSESEMMEVLTDYLPSPNRPEIGVRGIDLADFLNGISCRFPDAVEPLTAICNDRQFPWQPDTQVECPGKARDVIAAALVRHDEALWLTLEDPPAAPLSLTLRLGLARSARRPLRVECVEWPCRLPVVVDDESTVTVTGQLHRRAIRTSWIGPVALEQIQGPRRRRPSPIGPVAEYFGRARAH